MENLQDFVRRFSRDVGCYYTKNQTNYNLKKHDSDERGHMGVFGWVNERKTKHLFVVSTYRDLADDAAIADADREKAGAHFISRRRDHEGKGTGLFYYVRKGSSGRDYHKAVTALRVICHNR